MIYAENILACFAAPLLVSLFFVKGKVRRFVAFLVVGMVLCLLSAYISAFAASFEGVSASDAAIYISPIIEEIMKLLPLLFFISIFEPRDDDIVLVAVAIGIGFANFENCCLAIPGSVNDLTFMLIRGFAVGVMHVTCTAVVGYGLVLSRRTEAKGTSTVVGLLAFATAFHSLYNLLASASGIPNYIALGLPLLTAIALLAFLKWHKA
jgi:RsiW-degrading membrane proteinase PrsW (M82 family)